MTSGQNSGKPPLHRISRFFSPQVEESLRLRSLALAALWLASLSMGWVGGNLPIALLGGGLGTLGYWMGWRLRHQKSLVRPLLVAALVIGLSIYMRGPMLEVFNGNWLPVGQFLVFVQAFSSFESRTRGGLYAGLVLSGTVLFFASQQAFEPTFGIFVVGFIAVLLAFLTIAFLEDGIRGAWVHWSKRQPGMLPYWIGVACAVFILSGLAFWVMPKSELSLGGPEQLSVLPYSGVALAGGYEPPDINLEDLLPNLSPGAVDSSGQPLAEDDQSGRGPGDASGQEDRFSGFAAGQPPGAGDTGGTATVLGSYQDEPEIGFGSEAVFFVRTKISSYWRGRSLEYFDGKEWSADSAPTLLVPSTSREGVWFYRSNLNRRSRALYQQTFYVQQDNPNSVFTGYNPLSVSALDGSIDGVGVLEGSSYRVLSSYPDHNPWRLRRDSTWVSNRGLISTPRELRPALFGLARRITEGSSSDFEKIENIVSYIRQEKRFVRGWPGELTGNADLEDFLFRGFPGNAMDYATATVMLARASHLPARLAVGYLPGIRDPLSGAYKVREGDAHVWAEIYFANTGWVPFDASPRSDAVVGGGAADGLGFLLSPGAGDALFGAVKSAPSHLADTLLAVVGNPVLAVLGPLLFLTGLILRWVYTKQSKPGQRIQQVGKYSSRLPGEDRQELLRLYRQVEKLLRRKSGIRRDTWQTVGDFTKQAVTGQGAIKSDLDWYTRAVWDAAYNPGALPANVVGEGKDRLLRIKQSLNSKGRTAIAQ